MLGLRSHIFFVDDVTVAAAELVKGVFPNITQADVDRLIGVVRTQNPVVYQLIASQNTGAVIAQEADWKAEQQGAQAYVYYFTHTVAVRQGRLGAPHTAEIPVRQPGARRAADRTGDAEGAGAG